MEFTQSLLRLLEILFGFAFLLQSLEYLKLKSIFGELRVWDERLMREEFHYLPASFISGICFVLGEARVNVFLIARVILSVLLVFGGGNSLVLFLLLLSHFLTQLRFRGAFNGGSDFMTGVILLSLFVGSCFHQVEWAPRAVLGFIGVQSLLSYFVSGYVKLIQKDWRDGRALKGFAASNRYGSPKWLMDALSVPGMSRAASFLIIGIEMIFPFAILSPTLCLGFCTLGLIFHVLNFVVFGLNRFVWIWLATYPAIYFLSLYRA